MPLNAKWSKRPPVLLFYVGAPARLCDTFRHTPTVWFSSPLPTEIGEEPKWVEEEEVYRLLCFAA